MQRAAVIGHLESSIAYAMISKLEIPTGLLCDALGMIFSYADLLQCAITGPDLCLLQFI